MFGAAEGSGWREPPAPNYCRNEGIRLKYVPGKGWAHAHKQRRIGNGYVQACSQPHPSWCMRGQHVFGECWTGLDPQQIQGRR